MANSFVEHTNRLLSGWVHLTHRYALGLVLLASVATGALLYYTANNLGINTDTEEMLSETLPFRAKLQSLQVCI